MNAHATHCESPYGETHLARGEQPPANSHGETRPLSAAAPQELDLASDHKEVDLFPVELQSGSSPDDLSTTAYNRPRARGPSKLCQSPDPQTLRDHKRCFQVSILWGHLLGSNREQTRFLLFCYKLVKSSPPFINKEKDLCPASAPENAAGPRKQAFASIAFLQGTLWSFVFDMFVITRRLQSWMFKCFHSKSCYYPLEFPNLSTFAFRNSINMLVLVKPDILPDGEDGSELNRDFLSLFFLLNFISFFCCLLSLSLLVSSVD